MSHIIHRSLRTAPAVAVSAQGAYITDAGGHRYLDACGGAAVSCLGHAHPDVLAAMHRQIGWPMPTPVFSPPIRWNNWLSSLSAPRPVR